MTERRRKGFVSREAELKKRKESRAKVRDISPYSLWTACAPPSDDQLKAFEKDPYTAVAAFRLMAGIPADPRICSANLDFNVNEDEIISRFANFCGHGAAIKICGACGIGDIMAEGESYKLPLSHTRITFLECDSEYLECLSEQQRRSMHLLEHDGKVYHLHPKAFDDEEETVNICAGCYTSIAYAMKKGKPPMGTYAFYDYGVIPAHLPKLTLAEEIATSINIILQVILNLRPLNGVSQTAAKGNAIAVPLTGVQSLATTVYELPRQDLCDHIWLVVVAKKVMWKAMRRLLRRKGPLTCDPRKILATLLYRKGVANENYDQVRIPKPQDMDRIACNLNRQLQNLLDNALFSDSMIADRLLQRQRTEVEDEIEGLNSISCDEVIVKGVLLTESPNAANPMEQVLKSLKIKLDVVRESNLDGSRVSFTQPQPVRPNVGHNLDGDSKASADVSVDASRVSSTQPPSANSPQNLQGDSQVLTETSVKTKRTHKVYVEQKLINEFENNPELIGGAFATLLPLGFTKNDLGKSGTLPTKLVRTWLLSYDRRFATHRNFNHFLFNQKIRHETNLKVSMRVKGNDVRTRKLTKLVNEHDFEERLRMAVENPMGDEARRISKSVLPFLRIVGSKVKWSSLERSNTLTHLYAMNQFFGLSFLFVTLSPSMRNSPLALRLVYCSEDKELQLPDLVTRTKLIADNPVAAARTFNRVIVGFFEIICGMPLCHFTGRKTNVDRLLGKNKDGYIGVFGKLKGVYAITEDQTGGSLHMHGQLFGMLDQRVLTRWIHDKGFRKDVCNFLDAIVITEVPDAISLESQHFDRTTPVASQPYPTVEDLPLDSAFCRLRLNSHRHSFTCWKGECITCRMAYPRQFAQRTYVTEVIPDPNITNDLVPVRRYVVDSNGDEKISGPPLPTFNSPVDTSDARVLVSGLRRTSEVEQNQSESNPLTTVLLRCNTSIQPTIAPTEARNAVFYSSKYCSKNPYKLSSTLSFLYTAQLALRNYGSVADDVGTPTRTAKCLMQKVLHKAGHIEVADQQAAAANLGYDSFFCSHKFCYVFIWDAVKRLKRLVGADPSPIANSDSDNEEFDSVLEVDDEGQFYSITQFEKYIYRSSPLSLMSLYDYACCISHVQTRKKKNYLEIDSKFGRKRLKRYPFEGSGCKFPETLMQTVSTGLRVPIIAGAPPPADPGEKPVDGSDDDNKLWEKNARAFVEFYALLFLPFDHDMDPRDPTLPHLQVLPWNRETSWDNFTTIFRSWDVDTCGTGDTRMWYKRSTYRLFHNLVHSFKQPKLTRTLLAKWRALSADKRPNLNGIPNTSAIGSTREVWNKYSSDEDGDDCDDALALIDILRDKFGAAQRKLSRSEQLQGKVDAFLEERFRSQTELTSALTVNSEGDEEKISVEAYQKSREPYTVMSIKECTKIYSMIKKGESMDEDVDDDELTDEDDDELWLPNYSAAAEEQVVIGSDTTDSRNIKLTPAQRWCVEEMRKEMEKGQMLVFVHGPPGSGKTTTARLLVSERDLEVEFSGTTGTASFQHKAQTINSLLHLGRSVEDFDASTKRISPDIKNKIRCKFGDARILVID